MANAVSKAKAYKTYSEVKKVLNEKGVQAALAVLDSRVNNHIDKLMIANKMFADIMKEV
jgi:hypothetical protein